MARKTNAAKHYTPFTPDGATFAKVYSIDAFEKFQRWTCVLVASLCLNIYATVWNQWVWGSVSNRQTAEILKYLNIV